MVPTMVLISCLLLLCINIVNAFTTISKNHFQSITSTKQVPNLSNYNKNNNIIASPLSPLLLGKDEDEELKSEVEQALKQAEDAIKSAKVESSEKLPVVPPPSPPRAPSPPKKKEAKPPGGPLISKEQLQKITDGSASAVGGIILGTALGVGVDIYLSTDYSYNFQLLSTEATIPPAVLATLIGSLAFIASSQDNALGSITKNVLGNPTKLIGKGINSSIQKFIEGIVLYITSIPKRIQTSIQNKIDDTLEEVKQIPSKAGKAAKNVADDIVTEVKATPKKVADGTKKAIVETIDATEKQITKTVEETKEKVVKSVEDTVALPGKKIKELNEKVGNLIGGDSTEETVKLTPPKPPVDIPQPPPKPPVIDTKRKEILTKPPPPPPQKEETKAFALPSVPKISMPELPRQEEKTPPHHQRKQYHHLLKR